MASRKPKDLTLPLQGKLKLFEKRAEEAGLEFILTCTARDIRDQLALYAQGRMRLSFVNELRKLAGMAPIDWTTNQKKVTWTLNSRHVVDLSKGEKATAFDIALKTASGRGVHWDIKADVNGNEEADYDELGRIGRECGLTWGGDFKNKHGEPRPDRPHFQ
jgi:hypothetical protein